MKLTHDRSTRPIIFKIGQKVWLEASDIKTTRPSKKLDDKRYGPFEILEAIGPSSFKLRLPPTWNIHPVFHQSLLSPYSTPSFSSQIKPTPSPPDLIDDQEEWEVEEILDSRRRRDRTEFLIKWKDYPHEENTWEPKDNLKHAQKLFKQFRINHPNKPFQ